MIFLIVSTILCAASTRYTVFDFQQQCLVKYSNVLQHIGSAFFLDVKCQKIPIVYSSVFYLF